MAENHNKIRDALPYVLICVCTFGVMLLLNQRTVYTADDYMYHFFWEGAKPGPSTRLLSGIFDLPGSLWNHYLGFNGRVVSHALVMFFMLFERKTVLSGTSGSPGRSKIHSGLDRYQPDLRGSAGADSED